MRLFVYGTLKMDQRAHHLLNDFKPKFLGSVMTTSDYHLYELGWFPGMVQDESIQGGVTGELYEVDSECLNALDRYEGAPTLFRRSLVTLSDGSECTAYLYNHSVEEENRVEGGEWEGI